MLDLMVGDLFEVSAFGKNNFPLISPGKSNAVEAIEWFKKNSAAIISSLHINGAILFRGFDILSTEIFSEAISSIVPGLLSYRGGTSPRSRLDDGVYTSTEYPMQYEIALHNEMSYSVNSPDFICFACFIPPVDRGETPIADCRRLLTLLPDDLVSEFSERKVMYERNMFGRKSSYNSWSKAFETDDPEVVETHCRKADIEFTWMPNDQLRTREIRPATRLHPVTKEALWFNQVNLWHFSNSPLAAASLKPSQDGFPMNAYFGDGGILDIKMLDVIRSAYEHQKVLVKWQKGDLLLLDNKIMAHGRMPFSGQRKIVVAMGNSNK